MESRKRRLGDVLDDYCSRCRLLLNHAVVGMVSDEVRKVRCQTCQNEHVYRHARIPKKRDTKGKLYKKVLDTVVREQRGPRPATAASSNGDDGGPAEAAGADNAADESEGPVRRPRSHSLAAQLGVKKPRPAEPVSPSVKAQRDGRRPGPVRGGRPGGRNGPPGRFGPPGRNHRPGGGRRQKRDPNGIDHDQWNKPGKLFFGDTTVKDKNQKKRGRR